MYRLKKNEMAACLGLESVCVVPDVLDGWATIREERFHISKKCNPSAGLNSTV